MKRIHILILCLSIFIISNSYGDERLKIAATTSLYETGFLEYILPDFTAKYGIKTTVISAGTGKAIKLGENGDVDLLFIHAPDDENEFIRNGFGKNRKTIMYNDFIIIGPENDTARIKGSNNVKVAFKKIFKTRNKFVSRGDDSGTHKKEKSIWSELKVFPKGKWYMESGQGMTATIMIADEKNAYCLADRATFLTSKDKIRIIKLFDGDNNLINYYSVIAVSPQKHPHVQYISAM